MRTLLLLKMFMISLVCLVSCDNGPQNNEGPASGAIRFQMEWQTESTASSARTAASVDCHAKKIATLSADVTDSGEMHIQGGPWECIKGEGTIEDVPVGENRNVVLRALNAQGEEIYRGEASNIMVEKDQTATVPILMAPVFNRSITLVENIIQGAESSFPHRLLKMNDRLFFVACDAYLGFELFMADVNNGGAQLVKDIYPFNDALDRSGVMAPSGFVELNGGLYFRANSGSGYRIWRTDGTSANAEQVGAGYNNPTELTVLNNQIFFAADSSAHGRELWVYDHGNGQTTMVHDIRNGAAGSNPHELTAVGEYLYYAAGDSLHGYEIWRTHGTTGTTIKAVDFVQGTASSYPSDLTAVNGRLFFIASDGSQGGNTTPPPHGLEIWMLYINDNQVRVEVIGDINPSGNSSPTNLTAINETILAFSAYEPATGQELYLFDWTKDTAPRRITDLNPNSACSYPANFVFANGVLYFTAHNNNGKEHLWAYSLSQWEQLKCLTAEYQYISPRHLTFFNNTLYFSGIDPSGDRKLWMTDGIRTGIVTDGNNGATKYSPANLIAFQDRLYFSAFDNDNGEELFQLTGQ